jgi:phospholipid/cholesterol/gamma-HCH transport system substrate-binding protein
MIICKTFIWELMMNYKKMSFVVGIVIFFGFVILLVSIIGLSGKRIFFTRDYVIYVSFTDVVGLQDHAKVFMRGYRIGWTKAIQFEKNGVVVRIDINKKYDIPDDSKFALNMVSMLGEKAITITPGQSSQFLKQGDKVTGENQDIMNEAKKLLQQMKATLQTDQMQDKVTQLSESITLLHSFLKKLNTRINDVDVNEINDQINHVGKAGASIQKLADNNSDSIAVAVNNFNTAARNMNRLTNELTAISSRINQGQGTMGELAKNDEYIKNVNKTVEELYTLIEDFKKNPKKYINVSIF